MSTNPNLIPAELRKRPRWVAWREEVRDGKRTKVPYQPNGRKAATDDPRTWVPFEEVQKAASRFDGIGFVFTDEDALAGIDLDGCLDADGEIAPWAAEIRDHFPHAYIEVSPSGTGLKLWVKGVLPEGCRHKVNIDAPASAAKQPAIEAYDRLRYFTVTGRALSDVAEIGDGQDGINWLVERYLARPAPEASRASSSSTPNLDDQAIIDRARAAKNGGKFVALFDRGDLSLHKNDHSLADAALVQMLTFWTQDAAQIDRIFRASALMRPKWHERHHADGSTYGEGTIREALSKGGERYNPGVRVRDAFKWTSGGAAAPAPSSSTTWPDPPDNDAYYGLPGRFVAAFSAHTEADEVALLVNFLAAFGTAVGPGPHVYVGEERHVARDFFALVGQSSKARKGNSAAPVARVFDGMPGSQSRFRTTDGLSTGEGLISAVRDRVEKGVTNKRTGETEIEVIDEGVEDKRLQIVEPEFARVLAALKRQGNTLSAVARNAWDYRDLNTLTKSAMTATKPHVSIIGHITAEELRRELDDTTIANGLANRFIFVAVKRSKEIPRPQPLPRDAIQALHDEVEHALTLASDIGEMDFDEEADRAWRGLYHDLSADRGGLPGSLLARAEAHVLRLSMIYALTDARPVITLNHLAAALALWEYAEASVIHIFGDATGDPVADAILHALRASEGMSRTDIAGIFGRHKTGSEIERALELLEWLSRATRETVETAGRPAEIWRAA